MSKIPLLFISDAPSCTSGLGRITRELATRVHEHISDVFTVASLGYGAPGSLKIPFPQYHIHSIENWLIPELPLVWKDFAGDDQGVVMTIWDPSRLLWFANPAYCNIPGLKAFLKTAPFKRWGYWPIDAEGPTDNNLSILLKMAMKPYDRNLNYSKWATGITGYPDYLPHGIDTKVFHPKPKREAKYKLKEMGWPSAFRNGTLIGIVATNQPRKDFALAFQTLRELINGGMDAYAWIHIDDLKRHWDMSALVSDYDLAGRIIITTSNFSNDDMAWMYSACDVTLGIGAGEGFGYPIFESIACGTPCLHGDYGGAAEHLPEWMKMDPIAFRYESIYCNKRPVFSPGSWAQQVKYLVHESYPEVKLPLELDWNHLWKRWEKWFREGVKG